MLTLCLRGLNAGAMLTCGLSLGQWRPVRPACSSLSRCSQMAAVQPPSVPHRPFQLESSPAPSKTSSLIDRPRGNQVCNRIDTFRTPCTSAFLSPHRPEPRRFRSPLLPWACFSPWATNVASFSQDPITSPKVSKEALALCWPEMLGARIHCTQPYSGLPPGRASPDTHSSVRASASPWAGELGGPGRL